MNENETTRASRPQRSNRLRRVRGAVALLVLPTLFAVSKPAFASYGYCVYAQYSGAFYYCADTSATSAITSPDAISTMPVQASGGSTFLGFGALAIASADPSGLHAKASAMVTGGPPADGVSFTSGGISAQARVADSGFIVDPTNKLAVGTPVTMSIAMTLEGAFGGTAQAQTNLFVGGANPRAPLVEDRENFVYSGNPKSTIVITVSAAIGDPINFTYDLDAGANATNQAGEPSVSLADASNTALINFDFLESGVTFESASGHDYATDAIPSQPPGTPGSSVPEPAPVALVVAGAMAWASGRRRKGQR